MGVYIVSGVIAAIISTLLAGLISFKLQRDFFKKQNDQLDNREKQHDKKKGKFIIQAFLYESRFNKSIIALMEKQTGSYITFNITFKTECYNIFSRDIALLEDNFKKEVNDLYLRIYEANSKIVSYVESYEQIEDKSKPANWLGTLKNYFTDLKTPIEDFISNWEVDNKS